MPQARSPVRPAAAALLVVVVAALAVTLAPCGADRAPPPLTSPDVKPTLPADRPGPSAPRARTQPVDPPPTASAPPAEPGAGDAGVERVVRVRVLDSSGAPAVGALVVVHDTFAEAGGLARPILARTSTDAVGHAEIRVRGDHHPTLVHATLLAEAAVIGNLSVKPDQPADVELRLGAVVPLRGVVRFADGSSVAGVEVTGVFEVPHCRLRARATTRADGRFEFEGVPRAQFQRRTSLRLTRTPGLVWGGWTAVTPEEALAGDIAIVAYAPTRVRGRCVDGVSQPVPGAYLEFYGDRFNGGGASGDDGRFDFEAPRGVGYVDVHADGKQHRRVDDVRATGPELDLGDVVLSRADGK